MKHYYINFQKKIELLKLCGSYKKIIGDALHLLRYLKRKYITFVYFTKGFQQKWKCTFFLMIKGNVTKNSSKCGIFGSPPNLSN